MTKLKILWETMKGNARLIVVVILSIALVSGWVYGKHWYKSQIQASYTKGVDETDRKWETVIQQYRAEASSFKDQQQHKTDELARQLAEANAKGKALEDKLDKRQEAYKKSPQGNLVCLDDEFVDMYNESLGDR